MLFTKQKDGRLRWLAIHTNNFRDDDGKPEILSARSHKAFVYLVKEKLVPMPELWHWHIPGTRWGVADYVDFVEMEKGLFLLSTGLVDEGHEKEAAYLSGKDNLVSHGMPNNTLFYDPDDATVIGFYITKEISPLPRHRAANKFTGFFLQESDTMKGLRPEQREYLKSVSYTDEQIDQIQAALQTKDATAAEEGRATKEATEGEETNAQTPNLEARFAQMNTEVAEAVSAVIAPLVTRIDDLQAQVAEQGAKVKELTQQAAAAAAATVEATPTMSLKELMLQAAYGSPAAQIDGRSKLAQDAPKEKAATPVSVTGVPLLDALMHANVRQSTQS